MRLPKVSHGFFESPPLGGTFAMPSEPSDELISHLRGQHLAQALAYGASPTATVYAPPPPARGRPAARATSAAREPFVAPAPVPTDLGYSICWIL